MTDIDYYRLLSISVYRLTIRLALSEDSDIDWDLKERYGSLDGLEVSIDGEDIPLFLTSLDIFAYGIRFVELLAVMRINASYLSNAPSWTPMSFMVYSDTSTTTFRQF